MLTQSKAPVLVGKPFEPEMILIPAGEFLMGSDPTKDKDARSEELPQHRVWLPDYYMSKTPITNNQYAAFLQATNHRVPHVERGWDQPLYWRGKVPPEGKKNHPVVLIDWEDAVAYCYWLSEVTGKLYRLPTEAEWEKGARGTDGRIYPWGNRWNANWCNTMESGKDDITKVGAYPKGASPYGLLDMAGTVWEYCSTKWGKSYPYNAQEDEWTTGYLENSLDQTRVMRGGSWIYGAVYARCAFRHRICPVLSPTATTSYTGFRIVVSRS